MVKLGKLTILQHRSFTCIELEGVGRYLLILNKTKSLDKNFQGKLIRCCVQTYKGILNPKYGDGRDLFLVVWQGFLFILSHSSENPSFKGVLSNPIIATLGSILDFRLS